jgi:hypothetical protein
MLDEFLQSVLRRMEWLHVNNSSLRATSSEDIFANSEPGNQ